MASSVTNSDVLNSWKEVATYLGRGVRTVQRWEQELGLPVRRPRGKSRSAVIAFRRELDQWLQHSPGEIATNAHHPLTNGTSKTAARLHVNLHDNTNQLVMKTQQLLNRSTELCERMNNLKNQLNRAMELTRTRVTGNRLMVSKITPPPEEEPTAKSPALAS